MNPTNWNPIFLERPTARLAVPVLIGLSFIHMAQLRAAEPGSTTTPAEARPDAEKPSAVKASETGTLDLLVSTQDKDKGEKSPITGAIVRISGNSTEQQQTDKNGHAKLHKLTPGKLTLQVMVDGANSTCVYQATIVPGEQKLGLLVNLPSGACGRYPADKK